MLVSAALAQSGPDVREILERTSALYRAAAEYELIVDRTTTDPATGARQITHTIIAVKAPNRYRVEGTARSGVDGKPALGRVMVLDGTTFTIYDVALNQYSVWPASALGKDLPDEIDWSGIDFFTMHRYRDAGNKAESPKLLREEDITVGNTTASCYVVVVKLGREEFTWWIDKKNAHVLREDGREEGEDYSSVFTTVKLGEPLPESLLRFDPPPEARKNPLKVDGQDR